MNEIHVLDKETIDKIAAGEVVERPASVVKELVENAIDAKATSITVEIKDGGIRFMRITDNGSGIEKSQLRTAFLRHATSKIENAEDLNRIASLGFRGEALSSIAAVAQVEVITKTNGSLTGNRMLIEGGAEKSFEEVGAPDGTTFIIRNLFFNTPVRRKFLKQPATEGGYIVDLMEHMALSRPDISFKLIVGSQTKFYTSGNGNLKEVIYRIYGRDISSQVIPVDFEKDGFRIEGFLGTPSLVRSNRNHEIYFLNGRFIRSQMLSKAIEEGYSQYLMQHKFPFCILHMTIEDKSLVDVNVHPTKMEVRFSDGPIVFEMISSGIAECLKNKEMIPETDLPTPKEPVEKKEISACPTTRACVLQKGVKNSNPSGYGISYGIKELEIMTATLSESRESAKNSTQDASTQGQTDAVYQKVSVPEPFEAKRTEQFKVMEESRYEAERENGMDYRQETLFDTKILVEENRMKYRLIGQVFDTYWLLQFEDKLYIIDQHAAHEKVKYERFMKHYHEKSLVSQNLLPPIIVSLTGQEESTLKEYAESFRELGFEIEAFGGNEYALRSVPVDLYGCNEKQMFLEILDELMEVGPRTAIKVVEEKIASMACKAAVKGNNRLSFQEAEKLIDELLTLENPYNCPHGRPTIITMSKYEMEKRFKR